MANSLLVRGSLSELLECGEVPPRSRGETVGDVESLVLNTCGEVESVDCAPPFVARLWLGGTGSILAMLTGSEEGMLGGGVGVWPGLLGSAGRIGIGGALIVGMGIE